MRILLILLLLTLSTPAVNAQTVGEITKLPIPRFVSLRGDQVFARTGPGTRYPIKWVYQRKNLPVEIVQEFDTWRKIRDIDGEEGWVHQSLLSGKRFGSLKDGQAMPMLKSNNDDSRPVALVESGVILSLNECVVEWCSVSQSGFNGWISANSLWGVYEGETFE
jgi:SH3-like domain-containing protein